MNLSSRNPFTVSPSILYLQLGSKVHSLANVCLLIYVYFSRKRSSNFLFLCLTILRLICFYYVTHSLMQSIIRLKRQLDKIQICIIIFGTFIFLQFLPKISSSYMMKIVIVLTLCPSFCLFICLSVCTFLKSLFPYLPITPHLWTACHCS